MLTKSSITLPAPRASAAFPSAGSSIPYCVPRKKSGSGFSKDLHDGLGPLLSSAKMSVSALNSADMSEQNKEIIRNVNYVVDEAIRSLREISANLSPHVLNDFGLSRAISNFINKLPRGEMRIVFETNLKNERFDTDIEVILYRVVCELINNSLKHSGAARVDLSLHYQQGQIRIRYKDNGCGFDPDKVGQKGMGISNIFSRISSLKGEVSIDSSPGAGMRAVVDIHI